MKENVLLCRIWVNVISARRWLPILYSYYFFINIGVISIFLLIASFIGKRRGMNGKVILFIAATSLLVSGVFPYINNHLGFQNAFLITLAFIIFFSMIARRIEEGKQEQEREQANEAAAIPATTLVETPAAVPAAALVETPAAAMIAENVAQPAAVVTAAIVEVPADEPASLHSDIIEHIDVETTSQVTDETLSKEAAQVNETINEDVPVKEPIETQWPEFEPEPELELGPDLEPELVEAPPDDLVDSTEPARPHVEFENMLSNIQLAKAAGDYKQALASITEMIVLQPPPELLALAAVEAYRVYQSVGNYQKSRHILELVLYNEDGHINPTLGKEFEKKIKYSEILEGVLAKAGMAGIPVHHVPRYLKREADGEFRLWLKQINDGGV